MGRCSEKKTERILFNGLSITTWKLPDATPNASEEPLNKLLSYILFQPKVQIVHRRHYKNNQKRQQVRQLCPNKIKPLNLRVYFLLQHKLAGKEDNVSFCTFYNITTIHTQSFSTSDRKPLFSHISERIREQMYFATVREEEIYQMILQDASIEFIRRWNFSGSYLISSVSNSEIKKYPF